MYNSTPNVRDILKILWKRGKEEQFLLFSTIFCHLLLGLHAKIGTRFSLRDTRLFEISKVEITRVDCSIEDVQGEPLSRTQPKNDTKKKEQTNQDRQYTATN